MVTSEQIRDFRERSIRAARPDRRVFSESIDEKDIHLYAIRDLGGPLLYGIIDRIRDNFQCALVNRDFARELGSLWVRCTWEIYVNGRMYGPFEEDEVDEAMAVEMNRSRTKPHG